MASEITYGSSLSMSKGIGTAKVDDNSDTALTKADMAGTKRHKTTQNIGTSEEAIKVGDITSPGWAKFRNLDATNFIELYAATGETAFIKMLPGEIATFRMSATAPFAKADTATCDMEITLYEA